MARSERDQADDELSDEEDEDEEDLEETCPGCGLERSAWTGNGGQGYTTGGATHCCQSCAEGIDCTCTAQGAR